MATKDLAMSRYKRRLTLFALLYLATLGLMVYLDNTAWPPMPLRIAVALLPGLAVAGFFWAIGKLILEVQDEFIRMLVVRQSLIATAFALCAASIWGFLEGANIVPHLDAYWVAIAWHFGLIIGSVSNRIQHGTWGAV
jgi:MFS family permease